MMDGGGEDGQVVRRAKSGPLPVAGSRGERTHGAGSDSGRDPLRRRATLFDRFSFSPGKRGRSLRVSCRSFGGSLSSCFHVNCLKNEGNGSVKRWKNGKIEKLKRGGLDALSFRGRDIDGVFIVL